MPISHQSSVERFILAIVVLYERAPEDSQSLTSILQILGQNPRLAQCFSLIVYDNSLEPHALEMSASVPITYMHEPANAGLARAYNFALKHAEDAHQEWLLLLDQDTTLSSRFLDELIECAQGLRDHGAIASIVPKIMLGSRTLSPEANFLQRIRRPFARYYGMVKVDYEGAEKEGLVAYNSGATLRVSALQSIGGFPEEFWLDYLDHAVFHALSARRYRMHVMREVIAHKPSQAEIGNVLEWRLRNVLAAQTLFVKRAGNFIDRQFYRLWLLRDSRGLWISSSHRSLWREALLHAVFLRTPAKRSLKP